MIIENDLQKIKLYDQLGVDRIFLDLEIIGKFERQGHLNTVISSSHNILDVKKISSIINRAQLLVRVNPIHCNSKREINRCIEDGADILMLPMFKTREEVEEFVGCVNKRARVCLLLETSEALCRIDDILEVSGVDEVYIGLNDLHLSMNLKFMFELLSGGIVEYIIEKLKSKNIPYGFGGIAPLNQGLISGEMVLKEHVRLGSSMVILSRSFKDYFEGDFKKIHQEHTRLKEKYDEYKQDANKIMFEENKEKLKVIVSNIIKKVN